ncbi:NAD(P)-dependent oxidoreductase [Actinokineospora sp. NBRC 105648]|uniref:NAD-dependent epimerase/dehydratase family protein n=1 Tax=Actinokineospora sp. NBRC 105648 TaxID=3032206 RepID=UPI0024A58648|nr:NAD(P)-dependent oxidoreductase [Actinokineospora sp. NBRC 105648]GLZ40012.1 hypothetical protein Acsp05_36360 [Actinokineospora sp. NBRC 105648]
MTESALLSCPTDLGQVLVTGGTGFIGSAVVRALLGAGVSPAKTRVLSRRGLPEWMSAVGVRSVRADLPDPSGVDSAVAGVDTVLHLAAHVGSDPRRCDAVNIGGTRAILSAARRAGVRRTVQLSTSSVYGESVHRGHREVEITPAPASATSRSRLAAEEVALGEGSIVLRPHLVYGAGDRWFVPTLARVLRAVPTWVDGGTALASLVAVDDLGAAIARLADPAVDLEPGAILHVNHPVPVSMRWLISSLAAWTGFPLPSGSLPRAEHRERTRRALPWLTDHQFSLFADDHYYDSTRIWTATGVDPGPGPGVRLAAAAGWYRETLAGANSN